jgi:predicted nucleotidyltransferase
MERDLAKLKAYETELKRLGVERQYLFGSTARIDTGEAPMSIFSSTMNVASLAC